MKSLGKKMLIEYLPDNDNANVTFNEKHSIGQVFAFYYNEPNEEIRVITPHVRDGELEIYTAELYCFLEIPDETNTA